jgi:hypothetical protein
MTLIAAENVSGKNDNYAKMRENQRLKRNNYRAV